MNAVQPSASPFQTTSVEIQDNEAIKNLTIPAVKPLKIALLGYRSHPHVGGQGIYLKYLSRALAAIGHSVVVYSGQPYPELDKNIALVKVPSLDLYASDDHIRALRWRHLRSFTDTFEWWTMATGGFAEPYTFGRRVSKQLHNKNFDIIHDNQSLCHALVDLQKLGVPVVSTIHHPIHRDKMLALESEPRWFYRLLIKRWYGFLNMQERVVNKLQNVVTVSKISQQDIQKHFGRNCDNTPVIHNGIDTETFKPQPHIDKIPYRVITTASADQPLKGLSYLLQAVADLKSSYPEIHLRVIGKLKPNGTTQALLTKLALGKHVSFISGISTEELVEEYAASSAAVSPSLYEGFGLPAGEAMACGIPVIATNGGALPEVVGDAGIIVPAGDANAIAQQLTALFNNPLLQSELSLAGRKRIEQHFSWTQVAKELTQYYYSLQTLATEPCSP